MESVQSLIPFSLLIVEDDSSIRDVMAGMVPTRFPNCIVYTAENGMQGVELFKRFTPDLVVTDLSMPMMEGFEMIEEISATNPDALFIVLTASVEKLTFEKFRDLNVCTYLLKPLDFKELFQAIEKCSAQIKPRAS